MEGNGEGKGKGDDKGKGEDKGKGKGKYKGKGLSDKPFKFIPPDVALHFSERLPLHVWEKIDSYWELIYMELD